MVVKSDQERVRALLTEAISVLCKSGLNYKTEFTIEGLLGITIDSDDIFLVSIKETILKEKQPEVPRKEDKPLVKDAVRKSRHRKSTPRHREVVMVEEPEDYPTDMWTLSPIADSSNGLGDFQNCEVGSTASLESKRNAFSREGTPISQGSPPCHTSQSTLKDEPHRDITPQKRKRCNGSPQNSNPKRLNSSPTPQNSTHETLFIKHEQDLECEVNVVDTGEAALRLYPVKSEKEQPEDVAYDLRVSATAAAAPSLSRLLTGYSPLPGCSAWQASLANTQTPAALQSSSPASLLSPPPQDEKNADTEDDEKIKNRPVLKVPLYSITGKMKRDSLQEKPTKDTPKPNKASRISLEKKSLPSSDSDGASSCPDKENTDLGESKENNHSIENSMDGFYSYSIENGNQDSIEIFTVDSDDDDFKKPEEFIERFQGGEKTMGYKCKLCDKVYSNKWNCRRHIHYTHMNKSGYTCEICHNRYRDRSDYQEHMTVIHQGPGGYKCEFCDKVLMSKRSLKEHVSVHTGQYRYRCVECSRGFNRLNEYQQHMTKDHGVSISNISSAVVSHLFE